MKQTQKLLTVGLSIVAALAIIRELRYPQGLRTWRGSIFGIPYNFRLYRSLNELAETHWNPEGSVFVQQPFGLGWSLNIPALLRRAGLWPT